MMLEHFLENGGEWHSSPFFKSKVMSELNEGAALYRKALIVDNEDTDILIAKKFLLLKNVVEEVSADGDALSAIERIHREHRVPELIFVDLLLQQKELNKFLQLFTEIPAERTKHCKIILHSALLEYYEEEVMKAVKFPNVVGLLPKPMDSKLLGEIINKCKLHK